MKARIKNTSIQEWGNIAKKYFGKNIRAEKRKDREKIYSILDHMGLKRENLVVLSGNKINPEIFKEAVNKVGLPYWVSATPISKSINLKRLSALNLSNPSEGWNFLSQIKNISKYKILVIEYPINIVFKGSALVSKKRNGIVEFVRGDNHLQLIGGKTIEDPMIFDGKKILHYSNLVYKKYQSELYKKINNYAGHFEFQLGNLGNSKCLSFFDYNNELAYEDIDTVFLFLKKKLIHKPNANNNIICKGLPVSLGKIQGVCRIILNKNSKASDSLKNREILVTDFTSPEMTPLMAKASAIITDLGGMTSHAAIICREFKIPCIAGTKNATSKLKDGDKVIVDAFSGIVKKYEGVN